MRTHTALLLFALVVLSSGCAPDNDVGARYRLERAYFDARQLERDAYATYPVDAYHDWLVAVDAYNGVLLSNPARIPESVRWNPATLGDMERVALAAEIGLLRLEVVDYRFHDAVTHPAPSPWFLPELFGRVILERTAALYDSLGEDPLRRRCERRLRSVAANPVLWEGTALLRDSLLSVPLALADHDAEAMAAAEGFYSRVIASWPDSAAASRARDYRAGVRIARGDMEGALADIELSAASHPNQKRRTELELMQRDLLAFSLGRIDDARVLLRAIVERDPAGPAAWWARVRLAVLDDSAEERLRAIHMDVRAPYDVAATAMFARAVTLEQRGDWTEASTIFWRLTQRFPDSRPALAAPLHVLRALRAQGKREDADRALKQAAEYYRGVIRRDSFALEPRHLPKDCLIESYLLLNRPQDAVAALQSAVEGMSPDNRVTTAFKAAAIQRHLLGETEITVEILEKSLELSRGSRYARCIRWKLQRTREARDGSGG